MADVTIDQLSNTAPTISDVIPISQSGQTYSTVLAQLSSLPFISKAWVNFDGTTGTTVGSEFRCTVRSSFNVTKVVRNAAGDYSVYFTSSFADASYCAQVTSGVNSVLASNAPSAPSSCIGTQAVGNIRVHTYNSNTGAATAQLVNRPIVTVTVWR